MKHILLIFGLFCLNLFCTTAAFAQNIVLLDGNQPQVTDSCTGRLYDDGYFGNYSNFINETMTIQSVGNGCVQFTIDTLDIQGTATFTIYAGTTTSGTLLATLTAADNGNAPRQYFGEAITVRFLANAIGATSSGFVARWSCAANCAVLSPCASTVYDAGGSNGNYLPNQTITNTYCPNTPNRRMRVALSNIDVPVGDNLCIYDGSSVITTPIICLNNSNNGGNAGGSYLAQASATNTSGCLTIVLTSDAATEGAGFVGQLSCFKPCQTIVPQLLLNTTVPTYPTAVGDSAVNICRNQTVTVSATATYPQNNTLYTQNDANSLYWFDWNDGTPLTAMSGATHTATHTYTQGGIYWARVRVSDADSLCASTSANLLRVRVLPGLSYFLSSPPPICLGDTAQLNLFGPTSVCTFDTTNIIIRTNPNRFSTGAGVFCIPDYPGGVLTAVNIPLNINGLGGSTVSSGSIKYIYMNMQHSYMGDFDIQLACPNGRAVTLKAYGTGTGGNVFFGIANDNLSTCTEAGQGMHYGFVGANTTTIPYFSPDIPLTYNCPLATPNSYTMGLYNVSINGTSAVPHTQTLCNPYPVSNTSPTLNPGFYQSFNSLDTLNGCPLNGTWNLQITDHLGADNGIVYEWGMAFDEGFATGYETYTPNILQFGWVCDSTTVSPCVGGMSMPNALGSMDVVPTQVGNNTYHTRILIQDFPSCATNDTYVTLVVKPLPAIFPSVSTSTCLGETITIGDPNTCTTGAPTYTATGHAITINAVGNANPFPDTASVNITGNCTYKVGSVQLNGLTHTFPNDIDMWLVGPNGQSVVLMSDVGGSATITNGNYTFQMGAPAMPNATLTSTTYAPTDLTPGDAGIPANATTNLNSFTGSMNGVWRLYIIDDVNGDGGSLQSWSITFVKDNTVGPNYIWSTGETGPGITVSLPATYTATVTGTSGCSATASVTVNIDSGSIIASATPNTTTAPDGTATATPHCINPDLTYIWSNGATTQTILGLAAGVYTVTATAANGTTYTATATVGVFINTQISPKTAYDFTIQPNPTNGNIALSAVFETPTISVLRITNTVGQVLLTQTNAATPQLRLDIDLSNLPEGVYFATLQTANGQQTRKVMVVR